MFTREDNFGDNPTVKELFKGIIRKINAEDFGEVLTGFLICYQHIFVIYNNNIIIFINCSWVDTRWRWLFYM